MYLQARALEASAPTMFMVWLQAWLQEHQKY